MVKKIRTNINKHKTKATGKLTSVAIFINTIPKKLRNIKHLIKHHLRNISGIDKIRIGEISEYPEILSKDLMYLLNTIYKITLYIFIAIFLWLVLARLDSTVAGNGTITPSNRKKIIQHFEGGIVEKIFVNEGDFVKKGQTLMKLNDISAKSNLELDRKLLIQKQIEYSRLKAESALQSNIDTTGIVYEDKEYFDKISKQEELILSKNISVYNSKQNSVKEELVKNQIEINKNINKLKSLESYIKLINKDLKVEKLLAKRKMGDYEKMLKLEKELIEKKDEQQEIQKTISQLQRNTNEIQLKSKLIEEEYKKEVAQNISTTHNLISEIETKIATHSDIELRTKIKSPVDGIVTHMNINNDGENILQNTNIMEIIPSDEELIIEAMFSQKDISLIHNGLTAKIIPNLAENKLKKYFSGTVVHVSRDIKHTQDGNGSYFVVKIKLDKYKFGKLKVIPGMQATVLINLGSRAPVMYVLEPFMNSIVLSFNEY